MIKIKILLIEEALNRNYEIEKLSNYCDEIVLLTQLEVEREGFYSKIIQVELKKWDIILQEIVKEEKFGKFDCIIGFNEMSTELVDRISKYLKLPSISQSFSEAYRNKDRMRMIFESHKLNIPRYRILRNISEGVNCIDFEYPIVIKPLGLTGSNGVQKVEKYQELSKKLKNVFLADLEISDKKNKYSLCEIHEVKKEAIAEEFVYGQEYSAECMVYNGEFKILGITEKITSKSDYLEELAHIFPAEDDNIKNLEKIEKELALYHRALRFDFAYTHCEFKVMNNEVTMIEIGARPGGDMITKLMEYNCNFNAAKIFLEIRSKTLKKNIELKPKNFTAIYFISAPESSHLKSFDSIEFNNSEINVLEFEVYYKKGEYIEKPKTWKEIRLGHIIFETDTIKKTRDLIESISKRIKIITK